MGWVYLFAAGLLEIAFAVCLKLSAGFARPLWTACFLVCAVSSLGLLSLAVRTIPLGTAYAIWTGIGAAGTAAVGILLFDEPSSAVRLVLIAGLLACIAGLKLTSL